jgi:uracil-DNA glycosylase
MSAVHNISQEWLNIIYNSNTKKMLDDIMPKISNETPDKSDWFNWCRLTDLNNIKVIILGQDVYPTEGHAHGLSFSCLGSVPKSLKNIYRCLLNTGEIKCMPTGGDLSSWARQGVLLLNVGLTTEVKIAGAHLKLWQPYTEAIIKLICDYHCNKGNQLVFMLWGNFARAFKSHIDTDFHVVMEYTHPSPLAQSRTNKFIDCNHFTKANKFLVADDRAPIDWNSINPKQDPYTKILDMNETHHIVFTDGSCHPNNKSKDSRAGWASLFVSGCLKNKVICGNLDISKVYASNIRAEGYAIIRALEMIDSEKWNKITIITDCMFWIEMCEKYMGKWKPESFKQKTNSDLTTRMWFIYNKLSRIGDVIFMHVRSHNKEGWKGFPENSFERFCYDNNDYVDKKCNYARIKLQPCNEITETKC